MESPGIPVAGMVRVHKTMCGDHIPSWSRSVFWYCLLCIPVENIPVVRCKQALINCWMLRIKTMLSLWFPLEVPENLEYLFNMSPAR